MSRNLVLLEQTEREPRAEYLRTLAVTADLDNFSIFGRAFYSLPNSAVTTNSIQKFDFTAHLGNNKQQGYWVNVVKICIVSKEKSIPYLT